MLTFDGKKSEKRLAQVRARLMLVRGHRFRAYRKTSQTWAVKVEVPFTVDTLEGVHAGKAGDYLAVGAHGEMYPIDAAVFEDTYEPAE